MPGASQARPTSPASSPPEPRRLGGWIVVAMVLMVAWPLNFVAVLVPAWLVVREHGLGTIAARDPAWLTLTAWNVACSAALAALSAWSLAGMWRKRRAARKLAIAFFAANFAVGVVNYVINAVRAAPGAGPPSMLRVAIAAALAIAWVRYFTRSERVRETFVRP